MRQVSAYPRPIREIMTQWIPMADGCLLAARIWLPQDAEEDPVPAVLEYLPYRRRDGTATRDAVTQPYIAGHGYAAVRVDVRGTGDSQGVITDEYDLPELADGVAVIAWLEAQSWCSGRVGMWGISWGGFNALQVAARQPPALRAIIPMGFTHDRYDGDCHYMGGCVLEGNMSWGNSFLAGSSRPPDPEVVGPGWRDQWLKRLQALEHPIGIWLSHQRRDDYWKPGSVCEDFSRIQVPVYAVNGWQDSYARNVLPLLQGLTVPWKGLIGPWAHSVPHLARPGPAIGFLQEALRWWDHWLKDIDTGIMDEPKLRVWMGEWTQPRKFVAQWPGRWVEEKIWPPVGQREIRLHFHDGTLRDMPGAQAEVAVCSPQTLGLSAGYQCSYGLGPDLSDDQRDDDALSCCFDGDVLAADCEILGEAFAELEVSSDRPLAMLAVRLCDVAADGASLRVSYGLLNLSHRAGPEAPVVLEPGTRVRLRIPLCATAHRFAAGHRIRVAISTAYWPIAWPSPETATVTLHQASCALVLPVRPADPREPAPFGEPEGAVPVAIEILRPRQTERAQDQITTDPATGETILSRDRDRGAWRTVDTDVAYDATGLLRFAIKPDEPLSARQDFTLTSTIGRDGWRTRTITSSSLTSTVDEFVLISRLQAFEDDECVFQRDWHQRFKRDHV